MVKTSVCCSLTTRTTHKDLANDDEKDEKDDDAMCWVAYSSP